MNTNTQVFLDNHTTARAHLRGIGGVHGHDLRISFFRFVRKQLLELSKTSIVCAKGQMMIGGHKLEIEIFKSDEGICINKITSSFVPEVKALISDMLMQFGNLVSSLVAAIAAPLPTRHFPLRNTELGQGPAHPTRILNQLAIGERKQAEQAHINADLWALMFSDLRLRQFNLKEDIPLIETTLNNNVLELGALWDFSVVFDLDLADVLDVEQRSVAVIEPEFAPIAISEFNAFPAITALESWEACLLACLDTPEECTIGLIEAAKCLLHTSSIQKAESIWVGAAKVSEIWPLFRIRDAITRFFVDSDSLFKRGVIHATRQFQKIVQLLDLFSVRVKPVLERTDHINVLFAPQYIA